MKGGGHAMAAGATIAPDRLSDFEAFLRGELAGDVAAASESSALMIDAALTAAGATPEFFAELDRAGPFGQGAPEPVFALPMHEVADAQELGEARHVRLVLKAGDGRTLRAIAFRAGQEDWGQRLLKSRGKRLHLAATLSRDHWGGRETVEARIIDAAEPR